MNNNLSKGDKVIISTREGKMLKGTYQHTAPNGKAYIKAEDGKAYERELKAVKKFADAETSFDTNIPSTAGFTIQPPKSQEWDINKRFEFLAQLVRMVISKTSVSLIVTGEGGLGKSYTVGRQLFLKKLSKLQDYIIIKGYSTARGLYKTMFENNGKLIIFDDCDEVLEDKIAKNLLKGALDSYDVREIHWISQTFDESVPSSFEFTGQVIFISNMSQDKIEQALLSRSMCIDLTMSSEDKLNRMQWIVDNSKDFMSKYKKEWKQESLDLIKANLADVRELSLRSLEKVLKIRAGEKDAIIEQEEGGEGVAIPWKELARFMLIS